MGRHPGYLCRTTLHHRGWSIDEIQAILGNPDKLEETGGITGSYYAVQRVFAGEQRLSIHREARQTIADLKGRLQRRKLDELLVRFEGIKGGLTMARTDPCGLRRCDLAEDILSTVTQVALLREYSVLTAETLAGIREFLTQHHQEVLDNLDAVKATKAADALDRWLDRAMVDVKSNDIGVIERALSRLRSTQRYYAVTHIMYLQYELGCAQRRLDQKRADATV
jgi:hypothetical protein